MEVMSVRMTEKDLIEAVTEYLQKRGMTPYQASEWDLQVLDLNRKEAVTYDG